MNTNTTNALNTEVKPACRRWFSENYFSNKTHLVILGIMWALSLLTVAFQINKGISSPDVDESFVLVILGLLYGMLSLYVMLVKANKKLMSYEDSGNKENHHGSI